MNDIATILQDTFNNVIKLQKSVCERNFTTIEVPQGTSIVGPYAFAGCADLGKVTFKSKPNSISENAFIECPKLLDITVPWNRAEDLSGAPWGAEFATINYVKYTKPLTFSITRNSCNENTVMGLAFDYVTFAPSVTITRTDYSDGWATFTVTGLSGKYVANERSQNWSVDSSKSNPADSVFTEYVENNVPNGTIRLEGGVPTINDLISKYTALKKISLWAELTTSSNNTLTFYGGGFVTGDVHNTIVKSYTYNYTISLDGELPSKEVPSSVTYLDTDETINSTIGCELAESFTAITPEYMDGYGPLEEDHYVLELQSINLDNEILTFAYEKAKNEVLSDGWSNNLSLSNKFQIEY